MEQHKGWKRYTKGIDKVGLSHDDYFKKYIPMEAERNDHNFVDQAQETTKRLPDEIYSLVDNAKKDLHGDFFIEIVIKSEQLLDGMTKNIMVARPTCPSPNYDRIAYHYHSASGEVELLWLIPSPSKCMQSFSTDYFSVKKDDRLIHDFVLRYNNGELDELERMKNSNLGPKKKIILTDL